MNPSFDVGVRVRVGKSAYGAFHEGRLGCVNRHRTNLVLVRFPGEDIGWYFFPDELVSLVVTG